MILQYLRMELTQLPEDKTYSAHDSAMIEYWRNIGLYAGLQEWENTFDKTFLFVDGPPFVTGTKHMGHILVDSSKSSVLNYYRMNGYKCANRNGYDCHGLPMEMAAQKELGLQSNADILLYGIDKFNAKCKEIIHRYTDSWKPSFEMIGRWVDFSTSYKTMDTNFMESIWWTFKQMWEKGLIYRGFKVMPYSTGCQTPWSNFEAGQCYKEKVTQSLYVYFPLKSDSTTGFVAWTTTPWTLPSNIALCVNKDLDYVFCSDGTRTYIVGSNSVKNLKLSSDVKLQILRTVKGSELVGMEYMSLFNYTPLSYHRIVEDNYVTQSEDAGTCIVHLSPAHGEDDFRVCLEKGIVSSKDVGSMCLVDDDGKFTSIVTEYQGMLVFDADKMITRDLKKRNQVLRVQEYRHQYPYCWRTDTPLIYKTVDSYFVAVTKLKDDMIRLNETINWYPESVGKNKFGSWLQNVKDWCISRYRNFGSCIPVWCSDDMTESICVGSIDELMELANLTERPTDLHREFVDNITIVSKTSGKILHRISHVLDCWYESGCVPFGQVHYPFENRDAIDSKEYLADFITEGVDQTRGWFYTLLVLSTAICNKAPFKNVICTGLIMDENKVKFSKRYGNFVDPTLLIKEFGGDVIRLYLLSSPAIKADVLYFSPDKVLKVKERLIPYVNACKFFIEHLLNYQKKGGKFDINAYTFTTNIIDRWILSRVNSLVNFVKTNMEKYQLDRVAQEIIEFIDDLTNWYVKLNRDRLKGFNGENEQIVSFSVLYRVLMKYVLLSAPFTPFTSEHIYQHLLPLNPTLPISVHMNRYPEVENMDNSIQEPFIMIQRVAKCIRSTRSSSTTHSSAKVPLKKCTIYSNDQQQMEFIKELLSYISDELNVIDFVCSPLDGNIQYVAKHDSKALGVKYRNNASKIIAELAHTSHDQLQLFMNEGKLQIGEFTLTRDEMTVCVIPNKSLDTNTIKSVIDGDLMISVDLEYNETIHNMWVTRLLVVAVQNLRKNAGLRPWNAINVYYTTENTKLMSLIEENQHVFVDRLSTSFANGQSVGIIDKDMTVTLYDDTDAQIKLMIVKLT